LLKPRFDDHVDASRIASSPDASRSRAHVASEQGLDDPASLKYVDIHDIVQS